MNLCVFFIIIIFVVFVLQQNKLKTTFITFFCCASLLCLCYCAFENSYIVLPFVFTNFKTVVVVAVAVGFVWIQTGINFVPVFYYTKST